MSDSSSRKVRRGKGWDLWAVLLLSNWTNPLPIDFSSNKQDAREILKRRARESKLRR